MATLEPNIPFPICRDCVWYQRTRLERLGLVKTRGSLRKCFHLNSISDREVMAKYVSHGQVTKRGVEDAFQYTTGMRMQFHPDAQVSTNCHSEGRYFERFTSTLRRLFNKKTAPKTYPSYGIVVTQKGLSIHPGN